MVYKSIIISWTDLPQGGRVFHINFGSGIISTSNVEALSKAIEAYAEQGKFESDIEECYDLMWQTMKEAIELKEDYLDSLYKRKGFSIEVINEAKIRLISRDLVHRIDYITLKAAPRNENNRIYYGKLIKDHAIKQKKRKSD